MSTYAHSANQHCLSDRQFSSGADLAPRLSWRLALRQLDITTGSNHNVLVNLTVPMAALQDHTVRTAIEHYVGSDIDPVNVARYIISDDRDAPNPQQMVMHLMTIQRFSERVIRACFLVNPNYSPNDPTSFPTRNNIENRTTLLNAIESKEARSLLWEAVNASVNNNNNNNKNNDDDVVMAINNGQRRRNNNHGGAIVGDLGHDFNDEHRDRYEYDEEAPVERQVDNITRKRNRDTETRAYSDWNGDDDDDDDDDGKAKKRKKKRKKQRKKKKSSHSFTHSSFFPILSLSLFWT
jgi:hypothetical protein